MEYKFVQPTNLQLLVHLIPNPSPKSFKNYNKNINPTVTSNKTSIVPYPTMANSLSQ